MSYIYRDKNIRWDELKNGWLKKTRGISFEEIMARLAGPDLIDVIAHPNSLRYPHQQMFVIKTDKRIFAVPFVENETTIFLKTIIPDRRMKKIYEEKKEHEAES